MSKPQMNGFANGFAPTPLNAASPRLRCGICQQKFSDPRVLPCLHSFCSACLRTIEPYAVGGGADDRDSGSMSVLNGSSFSISVKGRDTTTILCPSCDIEVDIPKNGVEELPSDFIINNELVIASLNQEAEQILCGLCTDTSSLEGSRAIARCFECSVNLCGFCVQAHRRQKKTSVHNVLTLDEARQKGVGRVSQPVVCAVHPTEELRLFCQTCDKLVCRDCCLAEHREHECAFVSTISDKHTCVMRELLNQTEPNLDILRKALDGIAAMSLAVRDRAEKVASEVHQYTDSYVKALLMHRDALLDRIDQLREAKERNLRMHRVQLEAILADFSTACDFTSKALQEGSDVELLMVKPVVMKRLQELNHMKYNVKPKEDDFMKFYPKQPAGMCNGFEVFGGISAKSVDPGKSTAKGEGLHVARQGQEAEFAVTLRDRDGEQWRRGGDDMKVDIIEKNKNAKCNKVVISDRLDGSFHVAYTADESGHYLISLSVGGQHIQGSPFTVSVKPKWRSHPGVFHCCTFCSSGGNKDISCGCGGTVTGGYKGCGHGHIGHPGKPHWSCCGSTEEKAECTRPPSISKHVTV
ncbi:TRIM45 [Branchiostoma lanceolatum]|uniref:TRIM45 protein n=1 Tax=Branchiostoma lanceolatum TaxID=7740 RepID=A0A8K0EZI1_BRALA|nr:TRIM45 [Branchiostoma lanceolatum]